MRKCKKCDNLSLTGWDLCKKCIQKYPYFLSFIEEGFVNGRPDLRFGRIEVYNNRETSAWADDELRFSFIINDDKEKAFWDFREKWDFKDVTEEAFKQMKRILKKEFSEVGDN